MIEFNDLSKKLGLAKRHIRRFVYMPNSALRYEVRENKKYFNENEVLDILKKGKELKEPL